MRYEVTFIIKRYESGRATYFAKLLGGISPPYQIPRDNDYAEQSFTYDDINQLNQFLKKAYSTFSEEEFILESIILQKPYRA